VLLWRRGRAPFKGKWSLPGGYLVPGETLEASIRRHLADKVDVRELAHLEQLETRSEPARNPRAWELATAYLGLVPAGLDPEVPTDTVWHPASALPPAAFDHGEIVQAGLSRLRAKLSYTNIAFALAPEVFTLSELRTIYVAALGREVSATNLQRVLRRSSSASARGSWR
jgi:8-oxo-dGTP diphosphatase